MKISQIDKIAPHIVCLARKNLAKFNFGTHTIDEEIETTSIEYLIAYAHREKTGISIPDCIVLLADFKHLQEAKYKIDILNAVNKLKERYPNFEPIIDETFCELVS